MVSVDAMLAGVQALAVISGGVIPAGRALAPALPVPSEAEGSEAEGRDLFL
jgi:hypothetical protein